MEQVAEMLPAPVETGLKSAQSALSHCQEAKTLEDTGDYEAARVALKPYWADIGAPPQTEDLPVATRAELLLRCGTLTGRLGGAHHLPNAQETAKDLIGASRALFAELGDDVKVFEAQSELAHCYWKEGGLDEARAILRGTLESIAERQFAEKTISEARALFLLGVVERSATRYADSLGYLQTAAKLLETSAEHLLLGRVHNELAANYQFIAATQDRAANTDRALLALTAAGIHFERAGHLRYRAFVENNLALLLREAGRFADAYEHLQQARRLFVRLEDRLAVAQTDETRARTLLAENRAAAAIDVACSAVETFAAAGEQALLTEALTTCGVALARAQADPAQARAAFEHAATVGEQSGSREPAGLALLSLLEELPSELSLADQETAYRRADELLEHTQAPEILTRLRAAARQIFSASASAEQDATVMAEIRTAAAEGEDFRQPTTGAHETVEQMIAAARNARSRSQISFTPEAVDAIARLFLTDNTEALRQRLFQTVITAATETEIDADAIEIVALRGVPEANFAAPWDGFSLKETTRQIERRLIEVALKQSAGGITGASRLLGFEHTESLNSVIKTRHLDLLKARTPPVRRRRSIIRKR